MKLPFQTSKLKYVTIDLWNTILASTNKDEMFATVCNKHNISFNEFIEAKKIVDQQKIDLKSTISQGSYWSLVLKRCTKFNLISIGCFTNDINEAYAELYNPNLVYSKLNTFIAGMTAQGITVLILSNTGYLRSHQINHILKSKCQIMVPVIGSDLIGSAKPTIDFYKKALGSVNKGEWLHIGDSDELDINPVNKIGGYTYKINNVNDWIILRNKWYE